MKGRTIVTPDPDSITAAMVRAMFRTESVPVSTAKEPSAAAVRVVTTRYPERGPVLPRERLRRAGATAANAVVKAWTDKGGKVFARSRAVPIKQFIVATRLPADQQQRLRETLLNLRDMKGGREAQDATGYKGFVAPAPDVESATIVWLGL